MLAVVDCPKSPPVAGFAAPKRDMLPVAPGAAVVLVLAVGVAEADEPKRLPEAEGLEAVAPL